MRPGTHHTNDNVIFNYNIARWYFLEFASFRKDLCVLVNSRLQFHEHIWSVVQKVRGLARELLQSTVCHYPSDMVSLFVSHISPLIDFSSSA